MNSDSNNSDNPMTIKIAERLAVVESKVKGFDHALPRIGKLETCVATIEKSLENLGQDITQLRCNGDKMVQSMTELSQQHGAIAARISKLFWTGAGVALVISALAAGVTLYDTWEGIQERNKRDLEISTMDDRQLEIKRAIKAVEKAVIKDVAE